MLLVCTEAAERTKAAALDFHSKAAFSEKLGIGADLGRLVGRQI